MKIIDLNEVCVEMQKNLCIDLQAYHLTKNGIKQSDVKRLYIHHFIFALCEMIEKQNPGSKVVFVDTGEYDIDILYTIHGKEQVNDLIERVSSKIQKMLPIRICRLGPGLASILDASVIKDMCSQKLKDIDPSKFTFEKAKKYTKKHGLKFLNGKYFNSIKTKLVLLT